jgi:hypothetical protein
MTGTRAATSLVSIAVGLLVVTACSTTDSRIEDEQALFESYPEEVQQRIREGRVDVGDTGEMVRMTLGNPNETSSVSEEQGDIVQWAYTKSRPGIGVGVGGGNYGYGRGGGGGGISVGSGPRKDYTAIVDFQNGIVSRVRYFEN